MATIEVTLENVSEADIVRVQTTLLVMVPFMVPDEAAVTIDLVDDDVVEETVVVEV